MAEDDSPASRRQAWKQGPTDGGWLALTDDELLFRIEALPADHSQDRTLLEVVRSDRHFFIRQEAAKKMRDHDLLKDHSGDRHIGQILVRGMTRDEDVAYLQKLSSETRHLEVRKAADAQLLIIEARRGRT
jgi:hypothetical protein